MKNVVQRQITKILAVSLTITMILSLKIFIPVAAETVFDEISNYSINRADFGKTATLNDLGKKNYWENQNIFLSESDTGGANIRFANAFVSHRYGTRNAVAIDGMYIKIANILSSEIIKPSVGFRFTAALQDDIASGGGDYSLVLDTQNGNLLLYHNYHYGYYNILIGDNDILKYDNVTGKEVILHTVLNSDGTVYNVTVYVGNEKVSAELPKSLIQSKCYSFNSWDSAYLCLAPGVKSGSNQSFSFDFIEYSNHKYADTAENTLNAAKSAIDAAPDAANDINNLALARSAINAFNNLLPWDKSELTEAQISKVINLKEDISELIAVDEEYLKKVYFSNTYMHGGSDYLNPKDGDTTSVYKTLNVDWANQMNVNSGENGVRFAFTNANDAVREGVRLPLKLNGGKIQFDNLEAKDGQEPKLTTLLSYDRQTSFAEEQKETNLSLVLDTKEGTLIARPSGQTVIAANDNLKLANIRGERFSYSFRLFSDNSLEVTLTIKGAEYKGIITTENFNKATLVTTSTNRILATVLAGDSQDGNTSDTSTYSFELTALGGEAKAKDINYDGEINSADLVALRRILLGSDANCGFSSDWDVNEDSVKDIRDLVNLKKSIVSSTAAYTTLDNSALMPKISEYTGEVDENGTPSWLDDIILSEVRIKTASDSGTFSSAVKVLDHYAEMGVNGIVLTPTYDPGTKGNGYSNIGIDTIDPAITGTKNYQEGFIEYARFVAKAHRRNIRIIADVVTWGTTEDSPILDSHPEWYQRDEEGNLVPKYGGVLYDWNNGDLQAWYAAQLEKFILITDCDGLRIDCAPQYVPEGFFEALQQHMRETHGKYIAIISEGRTENRTDYDTEINFLHDAGDFYKLTANDITDNWFYLKNKNIVDSINDGFLLRKTSENNVLSSELSPEYYSGEGKFKYYINILSNHDNDYYVSQGNRLAFGYQTIFSPFIPLFYIGEEWNNTHKVSGSDNALYFTEIDWDLLEEPQHKMFYEDVKEMIKIRRTYKDIFAFSDTLKNSNICKVPTTGAGNNDIVQGYARYAGRNGVIVIPNYSENKSTVTVNLSISTLENMTFSNKTYFSIKNLSTGEDIKVNTTKDDLAKGLTIEVEPMDQTVLYIKCDFVQMN